MIEFVVNGQRIIVFNGSCISCEFDGVSDLKYPDNVAFKPSDGIPELDPKEIEPEQTDDGSKLDV